MGSTPCTNRGRRGSPPARETDACPSPHLDLVASILGAAKGDSVFLASSCTFGNVVAGASTLESDQHTPTGQALLGVVGGPSAVVAQGLLPGEVLLVQHRARVLPVHRGKQGDQEKGVELHGDGHS